jgi:hypothetical protein
MNQKSLKMDFTRQKKGNILVVGGTGRNLGKTEFICRLVHRFSKTNITVIKIKTLYQGDERFHGKGYDMEDDYIIRKETGGGGLEDSKRFLEAGAKSVLYIRSRADKLGEAVKKALSAISRNEMIIIESNSVVNVLDPAAYVILADPDKEKHKPGSRKLIDRADIIIKSSGKSFETNPEEIDISIENDVWNYKA